MHAVSAKGARVRRRVAWMMPVVAAAMTALPAARADLIVDGGFEGQQFGSGSFNYQPSGLAWTFGSTSGVINVGTNGSAFGAPVPAPDGNQVAFLQSNTGDSHDTGVRGTISQPVNFGAGG